MANLKTKKTAAGAQQYSAPGATKALKSRLNKDINLVHDEKMTRGEFKKKYGMTVTKAQNMVYAADAADTTNVYSSNPKIKKMSDDYEKSLVKERMREENSGYSKGGMTKKKMGYNKGGYVNCGASVPGTQKK
jgi:uncharacterized low-complexity protein